MKPTIFTIGHSSHPIGRFTDLLRMADITAVADVRSSPFSRWQPQFNRNELQGSLRARDIAYSFLGAELGGRPEDPRLFSMGVADYERMAISDKFRLGLDRIISGSLKFRIALMCAELEPLDCHRCLLVGRQLIACGCNVVHIMGDGSLETHEQTEDRLLTLEDSRTDDLFFPRSQRLNDAYRSRARKVAFSLNRPAPKDGKNLSAP